MATIERLKEATEAQRDAITEPLGAYSRSQGFVWNPKNVTLALQDVGGIRGGLIGFIQWDWLYIEILAVDQRLRGQGWGRRLIDAAEAIAADEKCVGLWLSTFTFQAPDFYDRIGFTLCGRIDDYPPGHSRLFFKKEIGRVRQS